MVLSSASVAGCWRAAALIFVFPALANAQCIGTVAGGGVLDNTALGTTLYLTTSVAISSDHIVYFSDRTTVYAILQDGSLIDIAGNGNSSYCNDGGPAAQACLNQPSGIAIDSAGNLLFADFGNSRIRKVWASNGTIVTVAGNGQEDFCGDGGPATAACLNWPKGVVLDAAGNLLIADSSNNRIRKVWASNSTIVTVAGSDQSNFCGDGGLATAACLYSPGGVVLDAAGNLLIADSSNNRIRKVWASNSTIVTVAGSDQSNFCGDGGLATAACLYSPGGVVLDAAGNLLIADSSNNRIRKVWASNSTIVTVAGNGQEEFCGDGGPATAACLYSPFGLTIDPSSDSSILFADYGNNLIRKVWASNGTITTVAGSGVYCGDSSPATDACINEPYDVTVDTAGNILIADQGNNRIRKVWASNGTIVTVAGNGQEDFCGDGGPATEACLNWPEGVVLDADGNLFISDSLNQRVRKVWASNGTIVTVAGSDQGGFCGDGGPATAACLNQPQGVTVDNASNILIADSSNNRIRKVWASNGTIVTVAGNGTEGYAGDGGPATAACLNQPQGVTVDNASNILIADSSNNRIRKVWASNGTIVTVAGNGTEGYAGDGGPATGTCLSQPQGVAVDLVGNILIADTSNSRIRKVWASDGMIVTVAGDGTSEFCGDGSQAAGACLSQPQGMAVDLVGNILIADTTNGRIRVVVEASSIGCPAGYMCPCGTPLPCNDPSTYCPGDTTTSFSVSAGYYSVLEGANAVRTSQQRCPIGYYCSGGVRTACPPGTVGSYALQVSPTSCTYCAVGTYSAIADNRCLVCPPGSIANASGSAFCTWCPPSTFANGTSCEACPIGTYSLGGATACQTVPTFMSSFVWDNFSVLEVAQQGSFVSDNASSQAVAQWLVPLPFLILAVLPALYLLLSRWRKSDHQLVDHWLQRIDIFSLTHYVAEGASPVKHTSSLGGATTILAFGTIVAISASLLAQYSLDNQQQLPPITAPVLDDYAILSPMSAETPAGPFSGLQLNVMAMGPRCANITWSTSNMLAGEFTYSSQSNTTTGHAQHTFACPACAFRSISILDIYFDATCQTLLVQALAVGASGYVTSASFTASSGCPTAISSCPSLTSVAVAMVPTLETVVNEANNAQIRGFTVLPTTADTPPNDDPSTVWLRITLPLTATYTIQQVTNRTTVSQLLSSLIGLAGLIGAFSTAKFLFEIWRRSYDKYAKRPGKLPLHSTHGANGNGTAHKGIELTQFTVSNPLNTERRPVDSAPPTSPGSPTQGGVPSWE